MPARAPAAPAAPRPAPRPAASKRSRSSRSTRRETGRAASRSSLGQPRRRGSRGTLHDRTSGIPFFVEELAAALRQRPPAARPDGAGAGARRRRAAARRPCATRCCCASRPSAEARAPRRRPRRSPARSSTSTLVAGARRRGGLERAARRGLIVEIAAGRAAFRHPLARDAVYEDVPWLRRRALHRALAERAARPRRRRGRGRRALARRARLAHARSRRCCAAIEEPRGRPRLPRRRARSAARRSTCGRRASAAPSGSTVLERHAHCAELAGELAEAARAQREVVAARRGPRRRARARRRRAPAGGDLRAPGRPRARPRRAAASRRRRSPRTGCPARPPPSGSIAAGYLRAAGQHGEAVELTAARAREEAVRAERADLRARALGLEGVARVKGGEFDEGIETIQRGPLARARARADAGGRRGLSAPGHRARDRRRLRAARATRSTRRSASATRARPRAGADLPELHGLRAARARRLGPGACELCARPDHARRLGRGDARRRRRARARSRCGAAGARARPLLDALPRDGGAAGRGLDAGATAPPRSPGSPRSEGDLDAGRGALPLRARALGAQRGPSLRGLGPALGGGLLRRRRPARAGRARAPRRSSSIAASDAATPTRSPPSPTRSARPRSPRATPTPRSSSSRARPSCTRASTSRSSGRRSLRAGVAALAAAGERDAALERLVEAYRMARGAGRPAAGGRGGRRGRRARRVGRSTAWGGAPPPSDETAGLSRRELEVVRLVAQGLTNREIAARAGAQHRAPSTCTCATS